MLCYGAHLGGGASGRGAVARVCALVDYDDVEVTAFVICAVSGARVNLRVVCLGCVVFGQCSGVHHLGVAAYEVVKFDKFAVLVGPSVS